MRIVIAGLALAFAAWAQMPGLISPGPGTVHSVGGGGGTWSVVQAKYFDSGGNGTGGSGCTANTTTCTVTVSSVGAGHALIGFVMYQGSGSLRLSSINGETWTTCTNCGVGTGDTLDAKYVLSATGGETSFTCTATATVLNYISCGIIELAYTGSSIDFDAAISAVLTSCTSCSGGGTLTLTGTNDAILAVALPAGTISAITTYTAQLSYPNGNGVATLINTSSGANPTWTHSGGVVTVFRIALKGL